MSYEKPTANQDAQSGLRKSDRVFTIANLLTFLRIGLIPIFAIALVYQHFGWALAIFAVAGVSDGVDGFIARAMKQESELGTVIDPIADKLLMTTAFIMVSLSSVMPHERHLPVPFWVTATVIGRDVAIVCVAASITLMTGFRGFKPSWLGKASTFVQVVGVILILAATVYPIDNGLFLPATYATLAAFAVASGIHYIYHVAKLMRAAPVADPGAE
ncbi:MAG TPA: CDP-alcohol phosphatidyltransferase family protein [Pyrinomonadaceae bacterium]|jgi:cardiolipin synthase|nr:CDP-alcohol phosphatidyltransferase family protein [Pyrinomonadaceae bacterium]